MPIDDKEAGTCFSYTVQQILREEPKPTDAELQLKDTWDRIYFMREIENVLEQKLRKQYEDDLLKDLKVSQLLLDTLQTREKRFQHVWDERRRLYEKLSEIEEKQRKQREEIVEPAAMIIFQNIDPELPEEVIQLIAKQICK